jgi:DNA helicase HerA-like ATPase
MQEFERLGVFYLGRIHDLETREDTDELLLYDSRDLVTHAVCVGMTGSGKTGLCVGLLEEAAIDGIPAIVIDPKGNLSSLLLAFPELRPSDFEPCEGSLRRLGVDYVDLYRCHRFDESVPLDETLRAARRPHRAGQSAVHRRQ